MAYGSRWAAKRTADAQAGFDTAGCDGFASDGTGTAAPPQPVPTISRQRRAACGFQPSVLPDITRYRCVITRRLLHNGEDAATGSQKRLYDMEPTLHYDQLLTQITDLIPVVMEEPFCQVTRRCTTKKPSNSSVPRIRHWPRSGRAGRGPVR